MLKSRIRLEAGKPRVKVFKGNFADYGCHYARDGVALHRVRHQTPRKGQYLYVLGSYLFSLYDTAHRRTILCYGAEKQKPVSKAIEQLLGAR